MSTHSESTFISIEAYLSAEETALEKHEYYNGNVHKMESSSIDQNRIIRNATTAIGTYLIDKKCELFLCNLRICVEANLFFTYPDVVIFCEPIKTYKNRNDTATNPVVIIEVLSKSTQDYDRGSKFKLYRALPSLSEYILISSTELLLEKYSKQADNKWQFTTYNKPENKFPIASIGLEIEVNSLYRGVTFEE